MTKQSVLECATSLKGLIEWRVVIQGFMYVGSALYGKLWACYVEFATYSRYVRGTEILLCMNKNVVVVISLHI